jgi:hypothetical protein
LSTTAGVGYTLIASMNTNAISSNKKTIISGVANINDCSPYVANYNFMQSGSLTLRGINANHGGATNLTTNTAGLLLECWDNTE